jgi:DNA polymerase III alpha subunit
MCALFNFTERNKEDRAGNSIISRYIRYCKQRGVKILPPSVKDSQIKFSLTADGNIRWGLGEIKSIGVAAEEIITKQPFESFNDFLGKIEKRKVNKTKVLALIRSGALDCFGKRADLAKEYAAKMKIKDDELSKWVIDPKADEVDLLGFCISEKVVPDVDPEWMTANSILNLGEMAEMKKGLFFGRVKDAKKRKSRASGKEMMVVSMHDDSHDAEFFIWEKDISNCEEKIQKGKLIVAPLKQFDDGGGWFYCGPKTHLLVIEE